jgi:hypothetical protein
MADDVETLAESGATGATRQSPDEGPAQIDDRPPRRRRRRPRARSAALDLLRLPPPFRACASSASRAVIPAGKRSVAPSSNVTLICSIENLDETGGRQEVGSASGGVR